MTRSARLAIVATLWLGTTPGCFLIGYEGVHEARLLDAGSDGDAPTIDASMQRSDGGEDMMVDESMDSGSLADATIEPDDASPDAPGDASFSDAGSDAGSDAASDAGSDAASDASPSCVAPNACGGCGPLPHELGESCGVCGLGSYVCDGEEDVECSGGAAYPAAGGGTILIDDFEDGDRFVDGAGSLSGDWHTVQDGSGGTLVPSSGTALVPVAGGPSGSTYAMKVSGHGFKTWGAGLAVSLNANECRYDASKQQGFRFSAKGSGTLIVSAATRQTTPPTAGGTCVTNACNDHFNRTYQLTSTWTSYVVPFTSLKQTGWGTSAVFNATQLLYLQFSFGPNSNFELHVDNVSFF